MTLRSKRQLALWLSFSTMCVLLGANAHSKPAACGAGCTAIVHARIYPSPSAEPLPNGTVLIKGDVIVAVGQAGEIHLSPRARVLDATGLTLTAGFQNTHVHFTAPQWQGAKSLPGPQLERQLRDMLTRFGFTTVFDLASDLGNTSDLRRRINSGQVAGPRILTVGWALYPPEGVPFYVRLDTSAADLAKLKTPSTAREAERDVIEDVQGGADAIKLFTGSIASRTEIIPMPREVAIAATAEAHRRGKMVFTHATNLKGLEIALDAKVDILAHALERTDGLTPAHIDRMLQAGMSLIPTLNLFKEHDNLATILKMVGDYSGGGGEILFGTDVGNLPGYDPTDEYRLMARAGLDYRQILASLTTAPAHRFQLRNEGQVAPGMQADLVLLTGGDPAIDISAFSAVRYTLRAGKIIYRSDKADDH
jgi:imidazolonepropionase-like amidohydrolase